MREELKEFILEILENEVGSYDSLDEVDWDTVAGSVADNLLDTYSENFEDRIDSDD